MEHEEMTQKDHVMPEGRWQFDEKVTACFDDMLERSIPQYEVMRALVTLLTVKRIQKNTRVVDIGCSRGAQIAHVKRFIDPGEARFLCLEVSEPMLEASRQRFRNDPTVEIRKHDLRYDKYPSVNASVTLSVLTLQFVPIEYRQDILSDIFKTTVKGGALILVEKVLGGSAGINRDMFSGYLAMKQANGYTKEQIDRKRFALEGVLVPGTERFNRELLFQAGFHEIDCFWRFLNFAGWIAIK
jgi:tRNA (cmo5U34)-methyltransferase